MVNAVSFIGSNSICMHGVQKHFSEFDTKLVSNPICMGFRNIFLNLIQSLSSNQFMIKLPNFKSI